MSLGRTTSLAVTLAAVGCLGLVTLGFHLAPVVRPIDDLPQLATVQALAQWDGEWYANIARDGYWYSPGHQSPVAFFPAYPLAIRGAMELGVNRWLGGILLSLLSGVLAVVLFSRWARTVGGEPAAVTSVLLLALYPFSLYLYGIVYSDGLFLALAVGAFLALERRRLVLATFLAALATAARPVAPALVVGLVVREIELRRARGEKLTPLAFLPVLSVLGLAAFALFLQLRFGDALAFAHVQTAPGWDQAPGLHTWLKFAWFETLFPRVDPWVAVRLGGHAAITLGALALVVPTWRRLGAGYAAYVAVAVGLPALSSKDFQGLGRYVIAAFPLFLTGALLLKEHPRLRVGWLVASALILAALALGFGRGGYVA